MIQPAAMLLTALMQPHPQEPPPALIEPPGFDYTYIEASYLLIDIDGLGEDADGFGVAASLDVTQSTFGFIGLQSTSADVGGSDADFDVLDFGLGMHVPFNERLDFVGTVSAVLADAEALGLSDDESGYRLRAGARYHLTPSLELAGGLGVVDIDDPEAAFDASLLYGVTEQLHLRAGLEFGDEATGLALGLRLYPGH